MNTLEKQRPSAIDRRPITREQCAALDVQDPLAPMRDRFHLPPGVIYLDGNSLGALPRSVADRMARAIREEWGDGLIRSWNDAGWYPAPQRAGAKIARLIGADADEVVVCDSTSVNLFKVLVSAARLRPGRNVILAEKGNFPTDVYIDASVAEMLCLELHCIEPDGMEAAIENAGDRLAALQLTHVNYRTGRLYDMAGLTTLAQAKGGLVVWDLAHSAGAVPVDLNGCKADFAVGCGYKYLNGGPGAPAFLFVARRHLAEVHQPLTGWLGHASPFTFTHNYSPDPGIARMLTGTAPQLSLIALEEALCVFDDVEMPVVRAKNRALGEVFIALVEQELASFGFGLASPRDSAQRGSQVALTHPEGYAIIQALIARGIIGDFRAPAILRFGLAAPYVRYQDVWHAVATLRDVMEKRAWDTPTFNLRKAVT